MGVQTNPHGNGNVFRMAFKGFGSLPPTQWWNLKQKSVCLRPGIWDLQTKELNNVEGLIKKITSYHNWIRALTFHFKIFTDFKLLTTCVQLLQLYSLKSGPLFHFQQPAVLLKESSFKQLHRVNYETFHFYAIKLSNILKSLGHLTCPALTLNTWHYR